MPAKPKSKGRLHLIQSISTPLGFYVLALLIIEATMCIALTSSNKLDHEKIFSWMLYSFIGVIVIVTLFTCFAPRNLLYGKEEHLKPALEESALRDQIEDLIHANVKSECLQKHSEKGSLIP